MTTFSKDLETLYQNARTARAALKEITAKRLREYEAWARSGDDMSGPRWVAFTSITAPMLRVERAATEAYDGFWARLEAELFGEGG